MIHTYDITGMTCDNCVAKVKNELLKLSEVISAEVSLGKVVIEMSKHISTTALQQAISPDQKYVISESKSQKSGSMMLPDEANSFFETYKPLILIFIFITGISFITARVNNRVNAEVFMNYFMASFFIVFSFFKFLDLKGFAESYAMYDVLAIKVKAYGFIYPFIELALGIAYLTSFDLFFTNSATIIVMGFSSIGVIQSVVNKRKIRCACLGAVFNLPMSTVTIIEDLLMAGMAAVALFIAHQ